MNDYKKYIQLLNDSISKDIVNLNLNNKYLKIFYDEIKNSEKFLQTIIFVFEVLAFIMSNKFVNISCHNSFALQPSNAISTSICISLIL